MFGTLGSSKQIYIYHYLTIHFITITFTFHRHVCLAEKNTTLGSIGPRATTLGIKGTSITCTINCNYGKFTTLYTLETWFFAYIILNTLHLAINFYAKWNKQEIICAGVYYWCFWLEVD